MRLCLDGVCLPSRCEGTLTFDDSNLEAGVRTQLGVLMGTGPVEGDIAMSDVYPLESLSVQSKIIATLGGIECLTGLGFLDLSINSISDLAPLAGLTVLDTLYLNNNNISDLTPLVGLTVLGTLYLHNNSMIDCDMQSMNIATLEMTIVTANGGTFRHDCPCTPPGPDCR